MRRGSDFPAQLSVMLSILNLAYKLMAVWNAFQLQLKFQEREALLKQMELEAGPEDGLGATTSSGEPIDPNSLAAQKTR